MMSKKKPVDTYDLSGDEYDISESLIESDSLYIPEKEKETTFIEGDTDTIVSELITILKDDIKAI